MVKIAMPIPSRDFDPTEAAVSWRVLTGLGHEVVIATPDGQPGEADQIMLDGVGLDAWSRVPGLRRIRLFGLILRANADARSAYQAMTRDAGFQAPRRWDDLAAGDFGALLLVGGHRARGMRAYLESATLQRLTSAFFAADKPVGAICHGVLLAARSLGADGRSVLHGKRSTALTWRQERTADRLARLGRWWDSNYYRTYVEERGQPQGYMSVESEVTRALASPADFIDVAPDAPDHARKTSGLYRDNASDQRAGFVVMDGQYVSARWPGDVHSFAAALESVIRRHEERVDGSVKTSAPATR